MKRIVIERQPHASSGQTYDLIIVGGGIYGVMLTLQAVFRGLRPLLLERADFGGATSFNSLRIVHGGLRYLQALDLRRFRESVHERRWLMTTFPELVRPLTCLMPLYGHGLRRKPVLRAALMINDVLSRYRNRGVPPGNELPAGAVLGRDDTIALFPSVRTDGLQGAAQWHDAAVPDSQRLLMEALRWAVSLGATAMNYMEVLDISVCANRVVGVKARDGSSDTEAEFRSPVVINSAGPWCMDVANMQPAEVKPFFWPSLAWNILTDRPAPADCALAVVPQRQNAPTYFLHPWKGRLLAGTGHSAWNGDREPPSPSAEQIQLMLNDLNSAVPGLALSTANIDRIFAGILPASGPLSSEISTHAAFHDHGATGGPKGMFSICGVKFTTARYIAQLTLDKIFGRAAMGADKERRRPEPTTGWKMRSDCSRKSDLESYVDDIRRLIEEESPLNLQDVVFRRTTLWEERDLVGALAPRIAQLFGWPQSRQLEELQRLDLALGGGAAPTVDTSASNPRGEGRPTVLG
jgi:glycerol-3-phosphate dehydrogenase